MFKIKYPIIEIEQPSTKKALKFHRYLVRDEKILLMAKEANTLHDIFTAIKQVIKNCCLEDDLSFIDEMPLFDLEYIYLKLRSNSVKNLENFRIQDQEDGQFHDLQVIFDEIKVTFNEKFSDNLIQVDENIILKMKYPRADFYDDKDLERKLKAKDGIFKLVVALIGEVWNRDELMLLSEEEKQEFCDSLDLKTFHKIQEYLENIPSIKYEVKYKNTLGKEKTLRFTSLLDFFLYL